MSISRFISAVMPLCKMFKFMQCGFICIISFMGGIILRLTLRLFSFLGCVVSPLSHPSLTHFTLWLLLMSCHMIRNPIVRIRDMDSKKKNVKQSVSWRKGGLLQFSLSKISRKFENTRHQLQAPHHKGAPNGAPLHSLPVFRFFTSGKYKFPNS